MPLIVTAVWSMFWVSQSSRGAQCPGQATLFFNNTELDIIILCLIQSGIYMIWPCTLRDIKDNYLEFACIKYSADSLSETEDRISAPTQTCISESVREFSVPYNRIQINCENRIWFLNWWYNYKHFVQETCSYFLQSVIYVIQSVNLPY